MDKVLILNADYSALTICNLYKAFLLVFLQKAEVVCKLEGRLVKTVDRCFQAPSVIRLYDYVHVPYRKVGLSKQSVFRRDGHRCVYCGSSQNLTLDHVFPKSRGGKDDWGNLVTACQKCNAKKGHQTPQEAGMTLPYQPFRPSFTVYLRYLAGRPDASWEQFLRKS